MKSQNSRVGWFGRFERNHPFQFAVSATIALFTCAILFNLGLKHVRTVTIYTDPDGRPVLARNALGMKVSLDEAEEEPAEFKKFRRLPPEPKK